MPLSVLLHASPFGSCFALGIPRVENVAAQSLSRIERRSTVPAVVGGTRPVPQNCAL